jgi:uncharacterized protein YbjT (DUF2867 family)
LVKKGHQVRALGRDQKKLDGLKKIGAEVISVESFERESACDQAFAGADAAFLMLPPGYDREDFGLYQDRVGETLKRAAQKCALPYLVNLSSLGAQLSEGMGPIKGLHRQEERLKTLSKTNVVNLRPAYFMENLLWSIPTILQADVLKTSLHPEIAIPMVSTEDIGIKAAEFLELLNFKGQTVFEFTGPRPLTMVEVTRLIGPAIGKPNLKLAAQSIDEAKRELQALGMKPKMIDLMIEMYTAFNQGKCLPTQKITPDQKGKTTLEQFVTKSFVKAFQAQTEKQKIGAR